MRFSTADVKVANALKSHSRYNILILFSLDTDITYQDHFLLNRILSISAILFYFISFIALVFHNPEKVQK